MRTSTVILCFALLACVAMASETTVQSPAPFVWNPWDDFRNFCGAPSWKTFATWIFVNPLYGIIGPYAMGIARIINHDAWLKLPSVTQATYGDEDGLYAQEARPRARD